MPSKQIVKYEYSAFVIRIIKDPCHFFLISDFDQGMCKSVVDCFIKGLTPYQPLSASVDRNIPGYFLRKLQFIICEKSYEKILCKMDPNASSFIFKLPSNPFGTQKKGIHNLLKNFN